MNQKMDMEMKIQDREDRRMEIFLSGIERIFGHQTSPMPIQV